MTPTVAHVLDHDHSGGRTIKLVAMVTALLVQVGALVWGAATIAGSVRHLNIATAKLEQAILTLNNEQRALRERSIEQEIRLRVLESYERERRQP